MATNKTLTPTNVTIAIPAMADKPDASVFSNCIDKEADAINTLNSKIVSYHVATDVSLESLQSSLETLGASMQDGDVRSIDFSVVPATGVFAQARTFGFIRRIVSGRYLVSVQQGINAGKIINGYFVGNVWNWESVSDNIGRKTDRIRNGYFGNGATYTVPLDGLCAYCIVVSYVSGNNVGSIYVGIAVAGASPTNTGKITWLNQQPAGDMSVVMDGQNLTITSPSSIWACVSLTKL